MVCMVIFFFKEKIEIMGIRNDKLGKVLGIYGYSEYFFSKGKKTLLRLQIAPTFLYLKRQDIRRDIDRLDEFDNE